jgi:hypothetical protein
MTDGFENASTDYTAGSIAELVREYEARGNWTFVYLGAGHATIRDAQRTAARLGYKQANAMRYEASPEAVKASMSSLAEATKARRRAPERSSERFFADAGQSEQNYRGRSAEAPSRPQRPVEIRRGALGDALRRPIGGRPARPGRPGLSSQNLTAGSASSEALPAGPGHPPRDQWV